MCVDPVSVFCIIMFRHTQMYSGRSLNLNDYKVVVAIGGSLLKVVMETSILLGGRFLS